MENKMERTEILSWSVFIGAMFVGIGIGMIFDAGGIGMMIGMGVGYIASAIIETRAKSEAPIPQAEA